MTMENDAQAYPTNAWYQNMIQVPGEPSESTVARCRRGCRASGEFEGMYSRVVEVSCVVAFQKLSH